jgi:hypothetical protein
LGGCAKKFYSDGGLARVDAARILTAVPFRNHAGPCVRAREEEGNEQSSSDTETIAFPKTDDRRLALLKTLGKRRLAEKLTPCLQNAPND